MKTVLTILLILCFTFPAFASNYWQGGRGAWDIADVCISSVGCLYVNKYITQNKFKTFCVLTFCALLKEFLDFQYSKGFIQRTQFRDSIFDYNKKQFDYKDIIRFEIGFVIALPIMK